MRLLNSFQFLFLSLSALLYMSSNLYAQTGISQINANYDDITDTSDDYTAGGITYRFNRGSENNLRLNSVDVGADNFQSVRFADRILLQRVEDGGVTGNKQLMFYENFAEPTDGIDLKPGFNNTMEEVLLNQVINRGTDNVFGNQGDGSGNDNNIERIDFIFDNGIVVTPDNTEEGFILLERNGNDDFKIAAITSLDSQGEPAGYQSVLSVNNSVWAPGTNAFSIVTDVMSSSSPSFDLERTTQVGAQTINGILVSYDDLGLSSGDVFFGYSLAGGDVSTTAADWLDVTVEANFPTNTSSSSSSAGGLDLIAGGSFSSSNFVEIEQQFRNGPCWRMLSSPISTTYGNLLEPFWTQGVPGSDSPPPETPSSNANVLIWPNDAAGISDADWETPANLTDPIPPGTGFIVSVFDDDDFDGTADGFPKTITATGSANSGSVSPTLNSTNSSAWTLVGNPYAVPIDFDDLIKTQLTNVAYVYDRNAGGFTGTNNGGWQTTDGSVGDLQNGVIAPVQGFFIQNSGSSPSLTFEEADQTTGSEFYGKENKEEKSVLRFQLTGEELINSAWLTFSESGSNTLIPGDALELTPFSVDYATLAFNKSGEELLDIAQFPSKEFIEIPFHAESTIPGNYTMEITDFELNTGLNLMLIDNKTGEEVRVTENFRYEFEIQGLKKNSLSGKCSNLHESSNTFKPYAQKAVREHRFSIKVEGASELKEIPTEVRLQQNYPNPFNPITQITYELPQNSNVRLEVFDMNGRQVATLVNERISAGTYTP